jgi:hypothetical protein
MKRERIIEILKDHELKRTDGVHQVMISGIFPELYDKLAEAIELKLSLTQQDESSVSAEDELLCFIDYTIALVDYIIALVDYIKLINEELDEVAVLAHAHGWRSSRFNEGVEMREKLNKCAKDCLLPQEFTPKTEKQ